jgi:putative flavoprotein involved in K+ transport
VPRVAADVPAHIKQLTPLDYCSPQQLEAGGVLIVGASATGMQFADEISKVGYDVTIATGEHVRMPRRYRGRDILDWMDRCGILGESYDEIEDLARGRRLPSSQLVGANDKDILDLNSLREQGVRIAGRLMGINNGTAQFSGSLHNVCALADLKMKRLLGAIDEFVSDQTDVPPAETFAATQVDESPLLMANLNRDDIKTIIWATGFRPDYSWLEMPVLDRKGNIQHDGGVVEASGLYVLGLPLMRARKSSFIFGINDDARYITSHLTNYLRTQTRNESHVVYQDDSSRTGFRRSA